VGERNAIVTGSPGAVLDAVTGALRAAGLSVHHHTLRQAQGERAEALPPPPVRSAELVVHLGVRTPRELDEEARTRVEVGAARSAAQLARALGAGRLVHVSTTAVYGRPRNLPCREGELKAPRTALERIRWRAEQASWAAFRRGAPVVVLRPALLYGPSLRGGPVRALSLVALFNHGKRRVPILRRGPVAHLVHLADLARAVVHVALHADARAVVGHAFNVADEAPLPLAEHLAAALVSLGFQPGRILPTWPRFTAALLWSIRHVPDRTLLAAGNRRLSTRWTRLAGRTGVSGLLVPRVDREALHWMSADHYYDTARLRALGWRADHPVAPAAFPEIIRVLVAGGYLPGPGGSAPSAS
jgi:nucleoside-diphosphate-sugar epimerase